MTKKQNWKLEIKIRFVMRTEGELIWLVGEGMATNQCTDAHAHVPLADAPTRMTADKSKIKPACSFEL